MLVITSFLSMYMNSARLIEQLEWTTTGSQRTQSRMFITMTSGQRLMSTSETNFIAANVMSVSSQSS